MDDFRNKGMSHTFSGPTNWLDNLTPDVAGRLITGASDIALVLDGDGIITDVALGSEDLTAEGYNNWRGRAWIDTVTVESRPKVEDLLKPADIDGAAQAREINHPRLKGPDVPMRYSVVRLGKGVTVALGRDLRNLSTLQQRLVEAQQTMEREYTRLRAAETRYRMLFHLASEPVVIVHSTSFRVVEANPAAQKHFSLGGKLINEVLPSAFAGDDAEALKALLMQARLNGKSDERQLHSAENGNAFSVSASLFRQDNASFLLVRMAPNKAAAADGLVGGTKPVLNVIENMPDGFVVIDKGLSIIEANAAFLDLVQLATKAQVIGQPLEKWLGRPGIDMPLLMTSMAEHGSVRNFASVIRAEYGRSEEVEITAVPTQSSNAPFYGFVVRSTNVRTAVSGHSDRALPRSVEHLTELVGRVSLKELVRESADVIERLCIEAALELSKDNRASAAQMLGLSRQSFYAKMRRYGLGGLDEDDIENS